MLEAVGGYTTKVITEACTMAEDTESFIHVVEVWVPDHKVLRHRSGAYGKYTDYARKSVVCTYAKGEGLPGAAWAGGRAVVWQDLHGHRVGRDSATKFGLDAGIAIPLYRGEVLTAVLVVLCGKRRRAGGCIEIWSPNLHNELVHAGGYYGRLEETLGTVSRRMRFPKGVGLPGKTWEHDNPLIIDDLRSDELFLRASPAKAYDIQMGLGIPLYRGGELAQVLLMLSAPASPIARAYEVWLPDAEGRLSLAQAVYGAGLETFAKVSREATFAPGEGLPGLCFAGAIPVVFGNIQVGPFVRFKAAEEAGLEVGVGIPIHNGNEVSAVVLLLS